MAPLMNDAEIREALSNLPGWEVRGTELRRVFELESFPAAIAFVTRVGFVAEAHDHHPDLTIAYRKVTFSVTTHDAGGLTEKDFLLAAEVAKIA